VMRIYVPQSITIAKLYYISVSVIGVFDEFVVSLLVNQP